MKIYVEVLEAVQIKVEWDFCGFVQKLMEKICIWRFLYVTFGILMDWDGSNKLIFYLQWF